MKKIKIPSILDISFREKGIQLPSYVFMEETKDIPIILFIFYKLFLMVTAFMARIRLHMIGSSYKKYQEAPDQNEV